MHWAGAVVLILWLVLLVAIGALSVYAIAGGLSRGRGHPTPRAARAERRRARLAR